MLRITQAKNIYCGYLLLVSPAGLASLVFLLVLPYFLLVGQKENQKPNRENQRRSSNYLEVKSYKMSENKIGNRGSKSEALANEKEQRVDGSRCFNTRHLRYTLMGREIGYQVKIPSNLIINKRFYSSNVEQSFSSKYSLNP